MLTFSLGTLTESINAIFGWSEWNTKVWYIVGALLGGYPLAQGTIYLLMNKRFCMQISRSGKGRFQLIRARPNPVAGSVGVVVEI